MVGEKNGRVAELKLKLLAVAEMDTRYLAVKMFFFALFFIIQNTSMSFFLKYTC